MSVIRVNKTNNYTVMCNQHLKNKNLSLKAKGLLSVMLSLPDNWDYTVNGLVAISKENITAIKSTLDELKKQGYLKVTKILPNKDNGGRIEYQYDIFETPIQEHEKQGAEVLPLETLPVENQQQLSTNIQNINELSIYNCKKNNKKKDFEEEFELLWKKYPKKQGKEKAMEKYISLRKAGKTDFDTVDKGIDNYVAYIENSNTEYKYVKHGSTFFNGECWKDEYKVENESVSIFDNDDKPQANSEYNDYMSGLKEFLKESNENGKC